MPSIQKSNNNWFAAYAFWLLNYYGHANVRLIDGGRKKWIAENRPLTQSVPDLPLQKYTIRGINRELRALRDDVASGLGKAGLGLVEGDQQAGGHRPLLGVTPGYE